MKKAISILLVLVICLSMTLTVFATNGNGAVDDDFVISPGEGGISCDHEHTSGDQKKDPTCTEDGYYDRVICEDCGEIVEPGKIIPSTGHEYKDGVCTICDDVYEPTTGDISVVLWVVLMVLAAAALVVVTVLYRKKA